MLREVLTVSALILAVLLVRAIFKNRVPKRMVYALWLVVLVKLCLPGTLVSLPILPAEETAAPVQRVELPAQTAPVVCSPRRLWCSRRFLRSSRFPRRRRLRNRRQSR